MEYLFPLMLTVHVLLGVGIIGLVLLQHGKGADMGAAFGGGASGSLFGASGSANFLSRTTAVLAAAFFITSLGLSYIAGNRPKAASSVMEAPVKPAPLVPTDGKAKIPSGEKPGTVSAPASTVPEGKAASPKPTGGKGTSAELPTAAKDASTPANAKSESQSQADKIEVPKAKADESVSRSTVAPADKKASESTSAPSRSESKAKEIPK